MNLIRRAGRFGREAGPEPTVGQGERRKGPMLWQDGRPTGTRRDNKMMNDETRMPKEILMTKAPIQVPSPDGGTIRAWRLGILSSFGLRG